MLMKRIWIWLLCIVTVLSLVGCGGSGEPSDSTTDPTVEAEQPGFADTASKGLEYELTEDGAGCIITGLGDCEDLFIVIPDTLEGKPVTGIRDAAFYCQEAIRGVKLGKHVLQVGEYAFFGCVAMEIVELNEGLTRLGQHAFSGCRKIQQIAIPATMEAIDAWAFFECVGLTKVEISDLRKWYDIAFGGVYSNPVQLAGALYVGDELLTELIVPEEITVIGAWTFAGCKDLKEVTLHASITEIGQRAFLHCDTLSRFTYPATLDAWRQVVLGTYWDFSIEEYVIACTDKEIKG